ncbi:PAS domain S-box-containing protein [Caldalkalibacillus uzonensis]|uniref:histidine kinase n=1 Tax=Caldalkalibacillus uzonensis TaxID=353224 RepID=A0ABU0CLW5_9BACI|nr:PAS domain-containing sensor histidine kinase [Caldalkalibacillus uzonensis]MDQ0337405.1 PAS domain S-box-containing protein [Caldalkalibacillus uzonensis]
MIQLFRSKLTKRYIFITSVVIFATLALLYGITTQVMKQSVQEQIEYRDELIAHTLSSRINFTLGSMIQDLRQASLFLLNKNAAAHEAFTAEMERRIATEPLYLFILSFDAQGHIVQSIPGTSFDQAVVIGHIHERLSWSKTYHVSPLISLPDGTPAIAVAHPAVDEDGTFEGGVVAFLNLNVLSDHLNKLKIGEEGVNVLIDRQGHVVGHSSPQWIGTNIHQHPLGQHLYRDRYGMWQGELFGEQMVAAYRPLRWGGMGLIVAEPFEQAMVPAHQLRNVLFKGFFAVLLIGIVLSTVLSLRVLHPILQLIRQVKEYQRNERKWFTPLKTKDEIEALSVTMGKMANALREQERRLFYILESVPYGVITTDQHGNIITFNKGAEKLTGFSRDEVLGRSIFTLPLKERKEEFVSWKTLKEGKAFDEVESYIYDKHGYKRDVRIYASRFRGEHEELLGTIVIMRDVSDMKKLEEYVRQSERLASLGQLTAGIAHEIKNPLSIIQAAAEALQLELTESPRQASPIEELVNDILETTHRMNQLLIHFLKLTKEEDNGEREPVSLVSVLNELLHLLRKRCNDQDIEVVKAYEQTGAWVHARRNGLVQVFLNIILNSLQAMGHGGTLSVQLRDKHDEWLVEIKDTGKGIPPSQLKWIFTPFYSTKREGTGLGLAIAHEIVTRHNGRIWAESAEGQGTTMFVQLPKSREEWDDETPSDC